jgi:predicted nucleotidyltransferase component of viral defense system
MLTQTQVRRYSAQSGLRDMMIAEKEVVLTFLLQLLSERGILDRLAFKGGTCLRKMFIGSQGRFSTDLDFTGLGEHDHEDVTGRNRFPAAAGPGHSGQPLHQRDRR